MIQNFDNYLFHAVNAFSGNHFLDSLADIEENTNLLKGGLFAAVYCWLWFEMRGHQRETHRKILIAMLMASFAALSIARALAHIVPFRVRPMLADPLYHTPSFTISSNYERWSSFPSDTAALFFALVVGVLATWRAGGLLLLVYTCVWICLPRLYLGLHYPSDLIAGAAVGLASAVFFLRLAKTPAYERWIGNPSLRLENRYPMIFYACAFPVLYEIAIMFADVRYAMHRSVFLSPAELAAIGVLLLSMVSLFTAFFWRRVKSNRQSSQLASVPGAAWTQPS